ncbi:MAG: hypothetical protein QOH93_3015 [Chloroflexia bacterium]|jgi:hypothetical protein|nr:hypothetical protein [Chloroflexia bacterium]
MNLNVLEKLAREIMKGNDVSLTSQALLNRAVLSPIEHRSLQSLSWQIAASARHTPSGNTTVASISTYRVWI